MAELLSALNYNGDTEELCKLRQDERVPWLELDSEYWWIKVFYQWKRYFGEGDILPKDNRCHAPGTKYRICFTHLPLELLPKSVLNGKCKLIYVARNPKDNADSFFHFHKMARFLGLQNIDWNEFFALYLSGSSKFSLLSVSPLPTFFQFTAVHGLNMFLATGNLPTLQLKKIA